MLKKKSQEKDTSRGFFEMAFLMLSGEKVADSDIKVSAEGKPYFAKAGWPKFSIAHSGDIWAVNFTEFGEEEETGMDMEIRNHSKKLTPRVLKRILAPGEQPVKGDYLNNFVIKEAFGKLIGTGLGVGFRSFDANNLIKKYRAADLSNDEYVWWILQGSNL